MTVKAGTGIIIRRGNKVLVGERQGSHGAGCLAFPGGHLDDDDNSLEEQIARETMEEVGMIITSAKVDPIFTTFDILGKNGQDRYLTSYMLADYVSGGDEYEPDKFTPCEPDKCKGWFFVTLEELFEILQDKDQHWIPTDRLKMYRPVFHI